MDPYLGEIRMFGFSFAPQGWAPCNGQILPIMQYQALFALLGTTYGGNGETTFALPNFEGRAPLSIGPDSQIGMMAGGYQVAQGSGPATTPTLTVNFCISAGGSPPPR